MAQISIFSKTGIFPVTKDSENPSDGKLVKHVLANAMNGPNFDSYLLHWEEQIPDIPGGKMCVMCYAHSSSGGALEDHIPEV